MKGGSWDRADEVKNASGTSSYEIGESVPLLMYMQCFRIRDIILTRSTIITRPIKLNIPDGVYNIEVSLPPLLCIA